MRLLVYNPEGKIFGNFPCTSKHNQPALRINNSPHIYILFAGREVRIEKNCARGLEYGPRPQAEGRAQDRGHSFSQYGPTKAGK